jgi:hypothetical protein
MRGLLLMAPRSSCGGGTGTERHPGAEIRERQFDQAERAEQHALIEVAEVSDPERLAGELPETGAEIE